MRFGYVALVKYLGVKAPRLHRLGSAPHPQANFIPPDLSREGLAGIDT